LDSYGFATRFEENAMSAFLILGGVIFVLLLIYLLYALLFPEKLS